MKNLVLTLLIVLGSFVTASGQNSTDLAAKYRQVTSYEVKPGVLMTPSYAVDGEVCRMVLEKRQQRGGQIVFGVSFSDKEIRDLADELVPQVQRGEDITDRLNVKIDGDFITTDYTYQNVVIRVNGTLRPAPAGNTIVTITWRNRVCDEVEARRQRGSGSGETASTAVASPTVTPQSTTARIIH